MLENYGLHYLNHRNICGYMESRLMERKKDKDSFTEKMQFWYMSLLKRL